MNDCKALHFEFLNGKIKQDLVHYWYFVEQPKSNDRMHLRCLLSFHFDSGKSRGSIKITVKSSSALLHTHTHHSWVTILQLSELQHPEDGLNKEPKVLTFATDLSQIIQLILNTRNSLQYCGVCGSCFSNRLRIDLWGDTGRIVETDWAFSHCGQHCVLTFAYNINIQHLSTDTYSVLSNQVSQTDLWQTCPAFRFSR